jgi:hypothetical protein
MAGVSSRMVDKLSQEIGRKKDKVLGADGKEYKNNSGANRSHLKKERTKFYRFKMDLDYKYEMEQFKIKSKKNENALLKEAFDFLRDKYGDGSD